jgi:transposase-like protein
MSLPTSHLLDVPGARLYYEIQGSGPALMLIGHPMGSSGFAAIAPLLAEDYTVVTYDPRGFDRSTIDDRDQDAEPDLLSADVRRVLEAVGDGPAHHGRALPGVTSGTSPPDRRAAQRMTTPRGRVARPPCMTPLGFRVRWPQDGAGRTLELMAGRKRKMHSAEEIVRKLRRADELAAEGKTGEQIAAELEVSAATLYNWRRSHGGMDVNAAKELRELREQNSKLKRLLAEAELEKDALREVAKGKF